MHASGGELGGEEPPGLGVRLPAGVGEVGHRVLQQPRQPRSLGGVSVARGAVHGSSVPPQLRVEGDREQPGDHPYRGHVGLGQVTNLQPVDRHDPERTGFGRHRYRDKVR